MESRRLRGAVGSFSRLVEIAGGDEALRELALLGDIVQIRHVVHPPHLRRHRRRELRVCVAECARRDAGCKVEVPPAVEINELAALPASNRERVPVIPAWDQRAVGEAAGPTTHGLQPAHVFMTAASKAPVSYEVPTGGAVATHVGGRARAAV